MQVPNMLSLGHWILAAWHSKPRPSAGLVVCLIQLGAVLSATPPRKFPPSRRLGAMGPLWTNPSTADSLIYILLRWNKNTSFWKTSTSSSCLLLHRWMVEWERRTKNATCKFQMLSCFWIVNNVEIYTTRWQHINLKGIEQDWIKCQNNQLEVQTGYSLLKTLWSVKKCFKGSAVY